MVPSQLPDCQVGRAPGHRAEQVSRYPVRYDERTYGRSNIAHIREAIKLLRMCAIASRKLKFL
jgi:hypothetical protein